MNQGQIVSWKDDRGFGFIKPNHGGQEVFLHISALTKKVRRPRVGDTILYKKITERNGKTRAVQASIKGVNPHSSSSKQKPRKQSRKNTMNKVVMFGIISLLIMKFDHSLFPSLMKFTSSNFDSLIASISNRETKPKCLVKGNISYNGGKKLYHIRGMEDYRNTKIDLDRGERWFCSEEEAISNGWQKAPK